MTRGDFASLGVASSDDCFGVVVFVVKFNDEGGEGDDESMGECDSKLG